MFFSACQTPAKLDQITPSKVVTYANKQGCVMIEKRGDSTVYIRTTNNDDFQWDTTMKVTQNGPVHSIEALEHYTFDDPLRGIVLHKDNRLSFYESSGFKWMNTCTRIPHLYEYFFYVLDQPTTIEGVLRQTKAGLTLNGIYLLTDSIELPTEGYVSVKGNITREPYPAYYYSTEASPQGIFSDNGPHYWLVLQPFSITTIPPKTYKGRLINSGGQAAFAWDMAFSEPYFFENKTTPWTNKELSTSVVIKGNLTRTVQERSFFVNWELIETE